MNQTIARGLWILALLLSVQGCSDEAAFGFGGKKNAPTPAQGEIRVLSNRADLLSGGDALVEVVLPDGVDPASVRVDVDGRDVSADFALRDNGHYMGLVRGLVVGHNVLRAIFPGGGQRITLINHPIGGPVFAGPQVQPWTCADGDPNDQCNREPTVEYMVSSGSGFSAYDPASPPASVPTTTTDEGRTVPFIIRVETGNIDRDQYRYAVLWDPAQPFEPWAPQDGFNHKLVIYHGASCDTSYEMASAPDVLDAAILGRGYATMSHALNNSGHNCNMVVQAEAMLMTKERVIETLGELRYTIGSGCSGGALAQQWVANAYPGLYQGITPACSFTDAYSSGIQRTDYTLLRAYLENPLKWEPGVVWDLLAIQSAIGHINPANPITFTAVIPDSGDPSRSCPGLAPEQVYDPVNNPTGVRCSLGDYWVSVLGRRPPEVWTEIEKLRGEGFAYGPSDNVGVQFGLRGLMDGTISVAQFIDLNVKIGGFDIDRNPIPMRGDADTVGLERIYRAGGVNTASNLDRTAIIDLRGPDPGAFHDVYRTYVMRARLEREHGTAQNQALWRGPIVLLGDTSFTEDAIVAMSGWLDAVEADPRDIPLAQKIIDNRNVPDRCTSGLGQDIAAAVCDAVVTSYSSPRIEAGMPFTDDFIKCRLKPLQRSDYYPIFFTDAQWAQLETVFSTGVCDFSQPGVGMGETVPWLSYRNGPGGQPLGEPPTSMGF